MKTRALGVMVTSTALGTELPVPSTDGNLRFTLNCRDPLLYNNNNNNEYLERLTRTGPKRLHVLYKYILSKFNAYNMNAHTQRLAHTQTRTHTDSHTHTHTHDFFFFK